MAAAPSEASEMNVPGLEGGFGVVPGDQVGAAPPAEVVHFEESEEVDEASVGCPSFVGQRRARESLDEEPE